MNNQVKINIETYKVKISENGKIANGIFQVYQFIENRDYYICDFQVLKNVGFSINITAPLLNYPTGFRFITKSEDFGQIPFYSKLEIQDFFQSSQLPEFSN